MKGKQILSLALAAVLSLGTLAGCGQAEEAGQKKNTASAKGRYLETDIALPEKMSAYDMVKLEDGTIRIATNDQKGREAVWDLQEDGYTWEKVYDFPQEWMQTDNFWVTHVVLSAKGDAFVVTSQMEEQASKADGEQMLQEHYYHVDGKGNPTEVPLQVEEYAYFMEYTKDGELLAQFQNTPISSVDMETGELTDKVSGVEDCSFFGVASNTIYMVDYDRQILLFDVKTGEPLPKDEGLTDSIAQSGANTDLQSLQSMPLVFAEGSEEQELFYCSDKGLYRHVKDGNLSELIIDGTLTSLGSPDLGLKNLEATDKGEFYVLGIDSQSDHLFRYTYSKDVATVPETELRAWSMYENSELMQNISQYQKENPEIYVNLDVGVTEENGVTVSDAIKNLSTEIMAGNGPDILVLDGLPVDSYVEKGLLDDLSDVARDAENVFTNLLSGMEQDGKIYGIPLRFSIPLVEADAQALEKIQDLKSLADLAEEQKSLEPDKNLYSPYYNGVMLTAQLYDACSAAWVKEDGTIEEERLEEFYTQLTRIYDPEKYQEVEIHVFGEGYQRFESSIGGGALEMYCDKFSLNFGDIWSVSDFSMIATTLMDKEEIDYKPLTGQAANIFVPKTVAGVSNKSKAKEEAKKFIQFLLTEDAQTAEHAGGLPVNQKALEFLISNITANTIIGSGMYNDPDSYVEMTIKKPDKAQVEQFVRIIKEAETPALTNEIIRNAVLEQAENCLSGKITPKAAVQAVTEKVNLYLAE